jgi:Cu(I)/Ag(I) efflux system membrane protein CusA/SilA
MIQRLIEVSVRHGALVFVLFVLLGGWGYWALKQTPLDAIPDLSENQVIVYAEWPGRGPQLVEDQITLRLSSGFGGLPGLKAARGQSFFGLSTLYLIFDDDIDPYWARSRVLERLSATQADLPAGVVPALGPDGTGVGHVYQYTLENDGSAPPLSLAELRSLHDWYVRPKLSNLEGVAEVASMGGFVAEYQVDIDPERLRSRGLMLDQVLEAVRASNADVGGRLLELTDAEYIIRGRGYLKGVEDLERVVVSASPSGVPVLVADVARVQVGGEMRRGVLEKNGEGEVVGGVVVMRYGANAKAVIERVKARMEEVQRGLPAGVKVVPAYDRSELIDASIQTLVDALWEEALIVALVAVVFLFHVQSALVVVVTLPLAVLLAFIAMKYLGITSNIMSLGGIAIAIGELVDAAIVMVENAYRKLEEAGPKADRVAVVLESAKQVGPAIFFSLLIMIVSFAPIFMLTGQEGRLFSPLAWTKSLAMAGAAALAVSLVPVLMVWLLRGKFVPEEKNPIARVSILLYTPLLRWALRHPRLTLLTNVVALAAAVPLSLNIFAQLFGLPVYPTLRWDLWGDERPEVVLTPIGSEVLVTPDEGDLLYMPTTLPGVSSSEARRLLQVTDKAFAAHPQVALVLGKVGRAETSTDPAPMSMIETYIKLKPRRAWPEGVTAADIIADLDAATRMPGLTNGWTQPIINRIQMLATGIRTDVGIKLFGPDLKTLEALAVEVEGLLRPIEGVQDLYADRLTSGRFIDVTIDFEAAARLGVRAADVNMVLETAIGGMPISELVQGRARYPIRARYAQDMRGDLEALEGALISAAGGMQVPLSDVAKVEVVEGPPMIRSEDGDLMAVTVFNVRGRDMVSVLSDVEAALQNLKLPDGYTYRISGQYENQQRLQARLRYIFPLALLIIFALLYVTFNGDVVEASLVMLSVPFALIGGIFLLYWMGEQFSVAVWVGFVALFGVAVETGVVMVMYLQEALDARRARGEWTRRAIYEATVEGSAQRLRPKLMTVATTLIGLSPLLWADGTGADVMRPIAIPMVGGMLTSAVHVLFVTPVIFVLMQERALKRAQRRAARGAGQTPDLTPAAALVVTAEGAPSCQQP